MTSENCPQCDKKLPPPFKSSGRQVCSGCGWTNKPKTVKSAPEPKLINGEVKTEPEPIHTLKEENKQPPKLNISINNQSVELDPVHLSGIAGSIILFLGTFTPLISLPIVGSLGLTSGTVKAFLIACAVASMILTLQKQYKWLTLTGLGATLTVSYIFLDFIMRIEDAKSSMDRELAGNPFRGLADVAMESIHLEWGWIFLFVGAGLILNTPRQAKIINLKQAIGGFFATGFAGMVLFAIIAPNIMAGDSLPRARESEGKNYVGALSRAQQVYRIENDQFTDSIYALDYINVDPTYYEISIMDADENKAIIVAKSLEKKHKIKSFSEGISYDDDSYQFERISCETKKHSTSINPPTLNYSGWSCGSGSIERE